jgi:hypothetical protein
MIWLGHGRNFFVTLDDLLTLRVPPPANDPTMMNAMAVAWLQCASLSLTISQSRVQAAPRRRPGVPIEDTSRDQRASAPRTRRPVREPSILGRKVTDTTSPGLNELA